MINRGEETRRTRTWSGSQAVEVANTEGQGASEKTNSTQHKRSRFGHGRC